MRGLVGRADRLQRFVMGLVLMCLNVIGLFKAPDVLKWIALGIQAELILTGLIGWCPFYWALGHPSGNGKNK